MWCSSGVETNAVRSGTQQAVSAAKKRYWDIQVPDGKGGYKIVSPSRPTLSRIKNNLIMTARKVIGLSARPPGSG